jgi:hypothetical protein
VKLFVTDRLVASRHLQVLGQAGLVEGRKQGHPDQAGR